jgi:hypothetical protein
LLNGTPVGENASIGFRGTTAADVDAVVEPPSDAFSLLMSFLLFYYASHLLIDC